MSESSIHIETIYAADQDESSSGGRLAIWGVVSLVVSAVWLYVVLWPVYNWAQPVLMLSSIDTATQHGVGLSPPKTGQTGLDELSQLFGQPAAPPSGGSSGSDENAEADKSDNARKTSPKSDGKKKTETGKGQPAKKPVSARAAGALVAMSAGAWVFVPAFLGFWIALAGASSLGNGAAARTLGKIVAVVSILSLGAVTWYIWKTTQWYESILPVWTKPVMLGLGVMFAVGVGLALSRKALFLHRFGAVLIILSACLTVVAFWANAKWGPSSPVEPLFYARVFAQQSAFGWITLIVLRGVK